MEREVWLGRRSSAALVHVPLQSALRGMQGCIVVDYL